MGGLHLAMIVLRKTRENEERKKMWLGHVGFPLFRYLLTGSCVYNFLFGLKTYEQLILANNQDANTLLQLWPINVLGEYVTFEGLNESQTTTNWTITTKENRTTRVNSRWDSIILRTFIKVQKSLRKSYNWIKSNRIIAFKDTGQNIWFNKFADRVIYRLHELTLED